jgi:hypothetical protein
VDELIEPGLRDRNRDEIERLRDSLRELASVLNVVQVAAVELLTRVKLLERVVYGAVALMLAAQLAALVALVTKLPR